VIVTQFIADIASYQVNLSVAPLLAAGMTGINVKTSHGLTSHSVHERADQYVREARAAGMQLSCFHWLTGDASGTAQADYAYRQMARLGLNVRGVAVVVDIEATSTSTGGVPTEEIYNAYVARMTALLGRPIITYTGDWWQQAHGWLVASAGRSPWLWAAPNNGYQPTYPGDTSDLWDAGYGGWESLAVMQHRVSPIAGIPVSQSAVRSPDLWADMTGVARMAWVNIPSLDSLVAEINRVGPDRSKESDGSIGDGEHAENSSDHNPDETGNTPYEDPDTINEVHAKDVTDKGPWLPGWSMERIVQTILTRCRSGQEKRLQNIIYNRRIWSASSGWVEKAYTGSNPHNKHAHFSGRYGSGSAPGNPEQITTPWGLVEDDMTPAEMTEWAKSAAGKAALGAAFADAAMPAPAGSNDEDGKWLFRTYVTNTYGAGINARNYAAGSQTASNAVLVKVTQDDGDKAEILAAITNAMREAVDVQQLAALILAGLPDTNVTPEEVQERVEAGLREVLGGLG